MKKHLVLIFSFSFYTLCSLAEGTLPKQLEAHVKKLAVDFHPRSYLDLENLERTAAYIETFFKAQGARVSSQLFEVDGNTYRNVIARFGVTDQPLRVVGAHYDAHVGTPGADDNASGVAGLLELSRLLGTMDAPPHVELVAYTLEEPPFFGSNNMGSYHHAAALDAAQTKVEWMIALEMIGYFSDKKGSQLYPMPGMEKIYPNKGNFIAVISRMDQIPLTRHVHKIMSEATDLPVEFLNAPERLPGVDFSDHRNYWKFNIPAVMITDTAFMRNQAYHGKGDTPDRLDYQRMAKVVEALFKVVTTK